MDIQWHNDVPCSSIAVESIISVVTGGLLWGSCAAGSYDAKQLGLTGIARASFVLEYFHLHGVGFEDTARKAIGGSHWKQVAVMAAFLSGFCALADQSTPI